MAAAGKRTETARRPEADLARGANAVWGIESGSGGGDPKAATTLDRAPFVFAHSAPYAGVLAGLECPLEARLGHRAPPAHGLGLLDLQERGAGRPDREEQLRVLVAADRIVTPVHGGKLLVSD